MRSRLVRSGAVAAALAIAAIGCGPAAEPVPSDRADHAPAAAPEIEDAPRPAPIASASATVTVTPPKAAPGRERLVHLAVAGMT